MLPSSGPNPCALWRLWDNPGVKRSTFFLLLLLWAALLVVAVFSDRAVAQWVHDVVPLDKHKHSVQTAQWLVRRPGNFLFTLCLAPFLALLHPRKWIASAALLLSGAASGVNVLIKWSTGRHRPVTGIAPFVFHPFPRGISGIRYEPSLCFPSGDATLAFVTAASLSVLLPRGKWIFFSIASLVALERVLENAHYVSDVVAGAGLGSVIGYCITRFVLDRFAADNNFVAQASSL